jgi:aryl-alcohol dehydrogenase-like predicted oxidoreductase
MDDLIRQGRTLHWGVSEWSAGQIDAAVELCEERGWAPPISNQPQYSALYRTIERDVLPTCQRRGLGSVVWSPLAQGVLTGKYRSVSDLPRGSRAAGPAGGFVRGFLRPEVLEAVQKLQPVAKRAGCTLPQLALAWCLREPAISSVIVGASRPEQLDETVAAADHVLDKDVVEEMDRILGPVAATE